MEHKRNDSIQKTQLIVEGQASGEVLVCVEGLSFWGGIDPQTGVIIDAHHPNHGDSVSYKCLLMPTSRGSCSGSGVLLQLALNNLAPAMIIFSEPEQVLTLGSIVCDRIFKISVPIICLSQKNYDAVASERWVDLRDHKLVLANQTINLDPISEDQLVLSEMDHAYLKGE